MDRRRWLERVDAEMAGRGLPARVRGRLLAELRDHWDDLTEGGTDMLTMERRMGNPGDLAAQAVAVHRRSGWVARHPVVAFGLAPVPAVLVAAGIYTVALAAVLGLAGSAKPEGIGRSAVDAAVYGMAFVPFLAVAAAIGWLAVRSGVRATWAAAGLAQVVVLAGLVTVSVTWSDLPGNSQFALGMGLPAIGLRSVLQMMMPLALGVRRVGVAAFRVGGGRVRDRFEGRDSVAALGLIVVQAFVDSAVS